MRHAPACPEPQFCRAPWNRSCVSSDGVVSKGTRANHPSQVEQAERQESEAGPGAHTCRSVSAPLAGSAWLCSCVIQGPLPPSCVTLDKLLNPSFPARNSG